MDTYLELLKQCKSKEEEFALKQMFIYIQCLKKHDRLRNIYTKRS